jgi:transcription initiation factor TFIIB
MIGCDHEDTFPVLTSNVCSLCKSESAITDPESAEIVCTCGMVISDKIEQTRHSLESKNTKVTAMPTSLARHDGLCTLIGRTDKDASGHKIKPYVHSTMGRLRTWNLRIQTDISTDRNLLPAYNELSTLKPKLGLSDAIIEKTAHVYRKAQERGLIRGRSISAVLTASIYISCRELGISKTLKEIAEANNISGKMVPKAYRMLLSKLDLKIPDSDPTKCIVRIANKVGLKESTKRLAIDIMDDVVKKEISAGKDPMALAATVLYISCLKVGEKKTQKDISEAAGVTGVTIRKRLKELTNTTQLIRTQYRCYAKASITPITRDSF